MTLVETVLSRDCPLCSTTRHTVVMARGTRAIQVLERSGAGFQIHEYVVVCDDISYGEAVALTLGVSPDRLFKTLIAIVDGSPVVAIVSVSGQLALKKLARAAGGKHASMAESTDAQRLTGYVVGGISPFGQKRRLPTFIDTSVDEGETVFVSAGRRGLQVELAPDDLVRLTGATRAHLSA
jgi:Cys-tRNA(Pro)/Cys-tRNA(Cys) deacylase